MSMKINDIQSYDHAVTKLFCLTGFRATPFPAPISAAKPITSPSRRRERLLARARRKLSGRGAAATCTR